MTNLDGWQQLSALEGWATNRSVPLTERLDAAMQVIEGLRLRIEYLRVERDFLLAEADDDLRDRYHRAVAGERGL